MADNKAGYGMLTTTDKVRVNAVIIQGFANNPNEFVTDFRNDVKKQLGPHIQGDRTESFQRSLDQLRDFLTSDIKNVPKVKENGVDDRNDLNAQMTLLRNLKDVMGKERPGNEHSAKQIGEITTRLKTENQDGVSRTLPDPEKRYQNEGSMMLKSQVRAACSANIACQPADNVEAPMRPMPKIPDGLGGNFKSR